MNATDRQTDKQSGVQKCPNVVALIINAHFCVSSDSSSVTMLCRLTALSYTSLLLLLCI